MDYSDCKPPTGCESLKLRIMDYGDPNSTARRCIALCRPFKHRKVLQIGGIHNVVGKPVTKQPSTLCSCFGRTELCIICSGRSDKIKRVRPGAMARGETTALLDHNYHKVLSASDGNNNDNSNLLNGTWYYIFKFMHI